MKKSNINLDNLKSSLSSERLQPYLAQSNNDLSKAIELYKYNLQISAALFEIIAIFEVVLRNSINKGLCSYYGNEWFKDKKFWSFLDSTTVDYKKDGKTLAQKIDEKIEILSKQSLEKVIAEQNLHFWESILHKRFEKLGFWKVSIDLIFPNMPANQKISSVKNQVNHIRNVRNRIAHHEQIIFKTKQSNFYNIKDTYEKIVTITRYCCKDAVLMIQDIQRVTS